MLKEFDLDVPGETKSRRLQFRSETRCVTALYERYYLPSKDTGKTWKVLVEVVDVVKRSNYVDMLGVLIVQIRGQVEHFFLLNDDQKQNQTLEFLMEGVGTVIQQKHWDPSPFFTAAEQVRQANFVNEWTWKKPCWNPKKTISAQIFVEHSVKEANISVQFRNLNRELIKTANLISDIPDEFAFKVHLGKLKWINESTIELVNVDGKRRLVANCS